MSTPRIGQVGPSFVAVWGKGDDDTAARYCELATKKLNDNFRPNAAWSCFAAADRGWFVAFFQLGKARKLSEPQVERAINDLRLAWVQLVDPAAIEEYERRTLRTADQAIEVDVYAPKGILTTLGPVEAVTYSGTLQGDSALYEHTFKGDARPLLVADEANRLHLIGGDYHVADVGIVDGPAEPTLGDEFEPEQPSEIAEQAIEPHAFQIEFHEGDNKYGGRKYKSFGGLKNALEIIAANHGPGPTYSKTYVQLLDESGEVIPGSKTRLDLNYDDFDAVTAQYAKTVSAYQKNPHARGPSFSVPLSASDLAVIGTALAFFEEEAGSRAKQADVRKLYVKISDYGPRFGTPEQLHAQARADWILRRGENPAIVEVPLSSSDLAIIEQALRAAEHQERDESRRHRIRRVKGKIHQERRTNPVNVGAGPLAMAQPGPFWNQLQDVGAGALASASPGPSPLQLPGFTNGPPLLGPRVAREVPQAPARMNPWSMADLPSGGRYVAYEDDKAEQKQVKAEIAAAKLNEAIEAHKPSKRLSAKARVEVSDLDELGSRVDRFMRLKKYSNFAHVGKVVTNKDVGKAKLKKGRYVAATDTYRMAFVPIADEVDARAVQSAFGLYPKGVDNYLGNWPDISRFTPDYKPGAIFESDALRRVTDYAKKAAKAHPNTEALSIFRVQRRKGAPLQAIGLPWGGDQFKALDEKEGRISKPLQGEGHKGKPAILDLDPDLIADAIKGHHGQVSISLSEDGEGPIKLERDDGEVHIIMPLRL